MWRMDLIESVFSEGEKNPSMFTSRIISNRHTQKSSLNVQSLLFCIMNTIEST